MQQLAQNPRRVESPNLSEGEQTMREIAGIKSQISTFTVDQQRLKEAVQN